MKRRVLTQILLMGLAAPQAMAADPLALRVLAAAAHRGQVLDGSPSEALSPGDGHPRREDRRQRGNPPEVEPRRDADQGCPSPRLQGPENRRVRLRRPSPRVPLTRPRAV